MQNSQDFRPTLDECYTARETFVRAFQNYSADNSKEIAIRCSLDAVWEAARRYQAQLESSEQQKKLIAEVAV